MEILEKVILSDFKFEITEDIKNMVEDVLEKKFPTVEKKLSQFEVTLTTIDTDPYKIIENMQKIAKSKMFEITEWKACLELTVNERPHIHMWISTPTVIQPSRIRKIHKERFTCSRVRNPRAYLEYLEKEKNNDKVINYCLEKKCEQFYNG